MGGKGKKTETESDGGTEDFSHGEQPGMGLLAILHLLLPMMTLTGEGGCLLGFWGEWKAHGLFGIGTFRVDLFGVKWERLTMILHLVCVCVCGLGVGRGLRY